MAIGIPPASPRKNMFPDAEEDGGDSWIRMGYTTAMLRNLPNKQLGTKKELQYIGIYWVKLGKQWGCVYFSGGSSNSSLFAPFRIFQQGWLMLAWRPVWVEAWHLRLAMSVLMWLLILLWHIFCFAHIKAVEKWQGQRHVHLSKASVRISWYLLMNPFNIGMGHLKNI